MNKDLKTSNEILNELNKSFYVVKSFVPSIPKEDGVEYSVYEETDENPMRFFFKVVKVGDSKKSILFNNQKYNNVNKLLEAVNEYNATLQFPCWLYDNFMRKSFSEEQKIDWYLTEVLGFKKSNDVWGENDAYEYTDIYGGKIMELRFEMNRSDSNNYEETNGKICKRAKLGWIYTKFDDASDAVKIINSLFNAEAALLIKNLVDSLGKSNGGFSDMKDAEMGTIESIINGTQVKYADFIIPKLEELLSALKGNN